MNSGRYIEEDAVSASYGLAVDEFLMGYYGNHHNPQPPTLRLYTYRSYCVLVGVFQDINREIRVDECIKRGFDISRRPTGGGAILMGEDQLGIAFVMRGENFKNIKNPREAFIHFSRCISEGLKSLGITSAFRVKNDITVNGRKIAGLGIYADEMDAWLFHASILVDFDTALMLELLNIPKEKLSIKSINEINDKLTTVRKEIGTTISAKIVREHIKKGFEKYLGIEFINRPLDNSELVKVKILEESKYSNPSWIYKGTFKYKNNEFIKKTESGLIRLYLEIENDLITSVKIHGDFFSNPSTIKAIEKNLIGKKLLKESIFRTVSEEYERSGWIIGIDPETFTSIILEAAENQNTSNYNYPSSCFIDQSALYESANGGKDG